MHRVYCKWEPGDLIWVKEVWIPDPPQDGTWDYCGFTDGVIYNWDCLPGRFKTPSHVVYAASWSGPPLRWKSSIHMFRWASRIARTIVSVCPQRIQDIDEMDALEEGVEGKVIVGTIKEAGRPPRTAEFIDGSAVDEFRELWDSINGQRELDGRNLGWASNPPVWAVTFEPVKESPQ